MQQRPPPPPPPRASLKKAAAGPQQRPTYRTMMAEWMRRAERAGQADDPPLWSDEVADQYSIAEREEYYDELCDRDAVKYGVTAPAASDGNDSDAPEEEPNLAATELNDLPGGREEALRKASEFLQARQRTILAGDDVISPDGTVRDGEPGCGYEVFDLRAIDAEPDDRLTELNGNQELLDPLDEETLGAAQFDQLSNHDTNDSAVFLRRLDPNVTVGDWLSPALEQHIASFKTARVGKTLEQWKLAFAGPVRRFIDAPRQTPKRVQHVYFVRKDLYLLLLLDRTETSFVVGAHFYAWGWQRANLLIQARQRQRKQQNKTPEK